MCHTAKQIEIRNTIMCVGIGNLELINLGVPKFRHITIMYLYLCYTVVENRHLKKSSQNTKIYLNQKKYTSYKNNIISLPQPHITLKYISQICNTDMQ